MKQLAVLFFLGLVAAVVLACGDTAEPTASAPTPNAGASAGGAVAEPTDTPAPTDTLEPPATARPDDTPIPKPTTPPEPTETTEPADTPTPEPAPTDTPAPTNTPEPPATVQPTATPVPQPTTPPRPTETAEPATPPTPRPEPTATPSPKPTPTPTLTPVPTPTSTPVPMATLEPGPTGGPEPPIARALAPLGGNLLLVAYLDRATQTWQGYDATGDFKPEDIPLPPGMQVPDASEVGILTELVPGTVYTFVVNEEQAVELNGNSYNFYSGGNLIAWR